jgi:hypothetical protein
MEPETQNQQPEAPKIYEGRNGVREAAKDYAERNPREETEREKSRILEKVPDKIAPDGTNEGVSLGEAKKAIARDHEERNKECEAFECRDFAGKIKMRGKDTSCGQW